MVAVPVPALHLPLTMAPDIAKPVAAVPVTVRVVETGIVDVPADVGEPPPPPPPQAARKAVSKATAINF